MRNDKETCELFSRKETIIKEFVSLVKQTTDLHYKSRGRENYIKQYTTDRGFYINYERFHGTFAIGEKTHPEQFIFKTKLQAQKQGCKEFIEWYNKNKTR